MGAIGQSGGKEIDVASLGQMPLLAQLSHRGGEVAHSQIGLPHIAQEGLEFALAAGRDAIYTEATTREVLPQDIGGEEVAEGMQLAHIHTLAKSILHSCLQDGSIGLIEELAGSAGDARLGMALRGDKRLGMPTQIDTMVGRAALAGSQHQQKLAAFAIHTHRMHLTHSMKGE